MILLPLLLERGIKKVVNIDETARKRSNMDESLIW